MMSLFRRNPLREAAVRAYARVVAQARQPIFFTEYRVPDTLDGRFDLICLHAFLYLHRLKQEHGRATELGQCFFDEMFADFDRSLREMGTGDLSVGRQVRRMAEAFYGRIQAYEQGLAGGDGALAAAVARNLFGTAPAEAWAAPALSRYIRAQSEALRDQDAAALLAWEPRFAPVPHPNEAAEAAE